jgi:hypothetical protein
MAVERKYERDIDILLAEEFAVSAEFASWFQQKTKFAGLSARLVDVFVSKADSSGESDLVILFEAESQRFALLIEDKIDAPLQPEQEARYRRRAQAAVRRGEYSDYQVILCSPRAYFEAQPKVASFDAFVSYEEISGFIREFDRSRRGEYRASFIATAASRSINTWARIDDEATNSFWNAAYRLASRDFPILEMRKPRFTKDQTWLSLRPRTLPMQPKQIQVLIKGDRGYVDLTFSNTTAHLFASAVTATLLDDMTVHQTAAAAAIRIETPGFRVTDGIVEGIPKVRSAFAAAERLVRLYLENRATLDRAAESATPVL